MDSLGRSAAYSSPTHSGPLCAGPGRNVSPFQLAASQAVLMTYQSVADACSSCPGTACAYLSKVVETRLWSSRRETTTTGTPALSISVAMKWRRS